MNLRTPIFTFALIATTTGCWELDPSAAENQEQTGRRDRGRDPGSFEAEDWRYTLRYDDVIITPDGRHLLATVPVPGPDRGFAEPGLMLTVRVLDVPTRVAPGDAAPAATTTTHTFPHIMNPRRINFAPDGSAAYVLGEDGRDIYAIDLTTYAARNVARVHRTFSVLDVSPDGRRLVLSNLPVRDAAEAFFDNGDCTDAERCTLASVATTSGVTWLVTRPTRIRDLDFAPDGALLVTGSTWDDAGQPRATVAWLDPETGATEAEVDFPNCADELVVSAATELALLAPTFCTTRRAAGGGYDPISVIDLADRRFIRNLPGFGPVALARDGRRALGFTRRADMLLAWDYVQREDFGLIVVDLPSLAWRVIEFGHDDPSYLLAGPTGRWAYVHHQGTYCSEGPTITCHELPPVLERYDLDAPVADTSAGGDPADVPAHVARVGEARLDRFAASADGASLYLLDAGRLWHLAVGAATLDAMPLSFVPELINIRPQGDALVLGESDAPRFYVLPLTGGARPLPVDLDLR